jgi:hypothetical protein
LEVAAVTVRRVVVDHVLLIVSDLEASRRFYLYGGQPTT